MPTQELRPYGCEAKGLPSYEASDAGGAQIKDISSRPTASYTFCEA